MAIATRQAYQNGSLPVIFMQRDSSLSSALHNLFREHRAWFLDFLTLDEAAPADTLIQAEWAQSAHFTRLMANYGDDIYRNHADMAREDKPLQSLWAQWYFGLIVPPMMLALIMETRALDCSLQHFHVQFHESGRPAKFWLDVREDEEAHYLNAPQRIDRLIQRHLIPAVEGIAQHGGINAKLIWNNNGYLMHWFLGEMKSWVDEATLLALEHALFFSRHLLDGSDNPLYRTVIPRDGGMQRRSCCQRYRLPDVDRCGDCTLKSV
ncbi:siderophore-iron reductase FhuF [Mixta intestinalis]|uniref:Ferric iron reductase protein FhuF n=1 Tax=Mixta intestinalis TaxID=1615494 RepID=A0A6P1Q645_9GAMM|nr:siderophore-iron reductase FhuF [Mixta intestinalis]QHM73882.1 Ferric iron reductase protein FhuF [Mixta intestinalis]